MKYLTRYLGFSLSYGFLRSIVITHNGTIKNEYGILKSDTRPLLYSEKFCIISLNTLISVFWCPIFIYSDIHDYELKSKGYVNSTTRKFLLDYIIKP